jgi:hypothetical protein
MSQRQQYAGFFHSDNDTSPRTQRIRHEYGVEPSATPAIADPLQALSMSYGEGFYMPIDRERSSSHESYARIPSQGSLSLSSSNDRLDINEESFGPQGSFFQEDSGYNTPFRSSRSSRKDRSRQGSRALDSDEEDHAATHSIPAPSSESSYRRMLPPSIHAPAPSQFLDGFDIEQYDIVKTPSPGDVGFSPRLNGQVAR